MKIRKAITMIHRVVTMF